MANQIQYGFISLKDVFARRITEVGVDVIATAIAKTVEEHNRQLAAIMGLLVTPTKQFKTRYLSSTAARLQPLDEYGRARPIKPAGYYDVSYPLQAGATAWGQTYLAREKMTVEEANEATATLLMADIRWMRDHILAALFANVAWAFTDDAHGALTIQGLANGDAVTYTILNGADVPAVDTHYLAQAAAIADGTNPFPVIYAELIEHAENGGQVVALIPTALKATAMALTNFVPVKDANIQSGSGVDVLTGTLGAAVPGQIFGYSDRVWLSEWRFLPADIIVAVCTDGDRPIAMREDETPSLQGFKQIARRDDHPFYESQWARYAGFGGFNRVGGVVYRVGNGAYAIPTNYTNPMA